MFHQTFEPHDLVLIGVLIVLEGLLSMDNALVLGLLAGRLREELRAKALTYGLVGALIFRILAIGTASRLMRWRSAQLLGGLYLLVVAFRYLWRAYRINALNRPEQSHTRDLNYANVRTTHELAFWLAVARIELTDVIFALDSILAAVALVGAPPPNTPTGQPHPKLWVVISGAMGGILFMRWAAVIFIKLLARFPRLEMSAYLLVMLIGVKMVLTYFMNPNMQMPRVDFNSPGDPLAWVGWALTLAIFLFGFMPASRGRQQQRD